MVRDVPLLLLAFTVGLYWATVALLVLVKRLRHGRSAGIIPRHAYERRLWLLIVPMVTAWILLPVLAGKDRFPWLSLQSWAQEVALVYVVRWAAAMLAVVCYVLSLYCWLVLGRHWSMAIVPEAPGQLVRKGPYRWVRHPIYALSVVLMLSSVVVLPTVPMVVLACLHLLAMNLKASHEERHLAASLGSAYDQYCREVGRFWPRWSAEQGAAERTA